MNKIPLLDIMDETAGTPGLHIAAILLAIAFTWFLSPAVFCSELGKAVRLNRTIYYLCKYVIPAALLLMIGVQLLGGIKIPGTSFIPGTRYIGSLFRLEGVILFILLILIAGFIFGKERR